VRRFMSLVLVAFAAGAFLVALGSAAYAQTPPKQPVIDRAPAQVRFRAQPLVTGHLEGGIAGDELVLQRKRDDVWRTIATGAVDEETRISFRLGELRRSGSYRLLHVDPATSMEYISEERVIRVRPRLTLRISPNHVIKGRQVTVSGRLYPVAPNRSVAIQHRVEGSWRSLGTAYVRDGQFALRVEARRRGYRRIRAVFRGDQVNTAKRRIAALRVYAPAPATWYGPGFYGNRTACGQRLTTETLGVAHRSLPCGTKVALLYGGRTIVVPVVDRGPYSHADWDLTRKTAERLRFSGSETIGVDPTS